MICIHMTVHIYECINLADVCVCVKLCTMKNNVPGKPRAQTSCGSVFTIHATPYQTNQALSTDTAAMAAMNKMK